jgi:predicted Zn-dependent protease with MMP-like domain
MVYLTTKALVSLSDDVTGQVLGRPLLAAAGARPWHDLSMVDVTLTTFEGLVADALDGIPENLGKAMENVAVIVDDATPAGRLLGLYEGVPLTKRGVRYSAVGPDRITIYKDSICHACHSEQEVIFMVRKTVIHEVAHHFGISDRRLKEWGWG